MLAFYTYPRAYKANNLSGYGLPTVLSLHYNGFEFGRAASLKCPFDYPCRSSRGLERMGDDHIPYALLELEEWLESLQNSKEKGNTAAKR